MHVGICGVAIHNTGINKHSISIQHLHTLSVSFLQNFTLKYLVAVLYYSLVHPLFQMLHQQMIKLTVYASVSLARTHTHTHTHTPVLFKTCQSICQSVTHRFDLLVVHVFCSADCIGQCHSLLVCPPFHPDSAIHPDHHFKRKFVA